MKIEFKDYFSENAGYYRQFRPHYPVELFAYLASISDYHDKAWDCATGNGQSALSLSDYFSEVIATDASKTQIKNAITKPGVLYQVSTAENSYIESNTIDLITVAQALHWFNLESFAKETNRVLKDGGLIAVWSYNLLSIQADIDEIIKHLYNSILEGFWHKERKMVEEGYRNVELPFIEIDSPQFQISEEWNLSQLMGYLCTWSAVNNYQKKLGINPIDNIYNEILKVWGHPDKVRQIKWPLKVRIWKK